MSRAKKDIPPRFPEFRDAFLELMGDMTLDQFSKKLEMSRATVGFYAAGQRIPDALGLKKIAEKCNVSADWLLGFTRDKNKNPAATDMLNLSPDAIMQIMILGDGKLKKTLDNFLTDPDFEVFLYTLNEIATSTKLHYMDKSNVDYDNWSIDDFEKDSELHSDLTEYVRFKLHERDAMIISGDFLIDLLKLKLNDALNEIVTGIISISIEEAKTEMQK